MLRARTLTVERLGIDPLGAVPVDAPAADRELAAFLAAGLAVGNVKAIGRSVRHVLSRLDAPATLAWPAHRWIRGPDVAVVADRIRSLQAQHGSLQGAFLQGYEPGDMRASLTRWVDRLRSGVTSTRGTDSLTVSPRGGSACKRMHLFLRWMVREQDFDLGLWDQVSAADLLMPLDVHVIAFARRYGLTQRRTVNWAMADEITGFFRGLEPADPLRWDFTISHHGMAVGW